MARDNDLKKTADPIRDDRTDRHTEEVRLEQMDELLLEAFMNAALPPVPKIPGWHCCWLSATNQYDTIESRKRLGYVPVEPEDVPGYEGMGNRSADYPGVISVNEMLLYKIPQASFERIMDLFHKKKPEEYDERLRANLELMQSGQLSKGQSIVKEIGDGTNELLKRPTRASGSGW